MLKVDDALKELAQKSYVDIQVETAWKWASRAAASYEALSTEEDKKALLASFMMAEEYFHEAMEHAALARDNILLQSIVNAVSPYEEKAAAHIHETFGSETSHD